MLEFITNEQEVLKDIPLASSGPAKIRLEGYPYIQIEEEASATETLKQLAENERYEERLRGVLAERKEEIKLAFEEGYTGLDKKIKSGYPLSFEEAYAVGMIVCCGVNSVLERTLIEQGLRNEEADQTSLLRATSLLQGLSVKESLVGLNPEEIAGVVASVIELDTVIRVEFGNEESVFAVGGMGGDRGIRADNGKNSKIFNSSTIATLGLGSYGSIHKHHSYPNTSKVGGQSAIENLGASSDFRSSKQMRRIINDSNILMTSCHSTRTIHTLSHILKGETINHLIGPLAIPHSEDQPLSMIIGVNQNVHPQTIIESLMILREKGVQAYDNSVAFCGIDESIKDIPHEILNPSGYYLNPALKNLVALDEVAPPPFTTLASFLAGDIIRTVLISPEDMIPKEYLDEFVYEELLIENSEERIIEANRSVIDSESHSRMIYLAMSVAIGLFSKEYSGKDDAFVENGTKVNSVYLQECFCRAFRDIQNGSLRTNLDKYVAASNY